MLRLIPTFRNVFLLLLSLVLFLGLGGCSMLDGQRAKCAALESDLQALGVPIVRVETSFRPSGLTRELDVRIRVDSDSISGDMLREVLVVLNEHRDIDYASGVLHFKSLDGESISLKSAALEIGIPRDLVSSGAFCFTRSTSFDFLYDS